MFFQKKINEGVSHDIRQLWAYLAIGIAYLLWMKSLLNYKLSKYPYEKKVKKKNIKKLYKEIINT